MHNQRKATTAENVDQAIKRLIRAGESINFNSVSKESGVSKASLYNHEDIRQRIDSLRQQQSKAPTPKQVKREMNESSKDVIIETLKRKIKTIENENKELREQMKKAYAQVYNKF
ncbi:DUF6262 family protein [Paenibacillus sp. 481]|uniref:DUF6262 family protein n=1 Tax=Paenibacillus sp. 481 TaxID=2835869 RepID=UPI001E57DF09|nr:DUF6262 family protein [Paenibacillus sp. 481]UHA76106.1 transposase [Paenibacillus sp. 481]